MIVDSNKHVYEVEYKTIWVWDNCPKVYPCKPTSTKNFSLWHNDTEHPQDEHLEVGFYFESAQLARYNKFECLSLEKNHRETYEVHVQIESSRKTL